MQKVAKTGDAPNYRPAENSNASCQSCFYFGKYANGSGYCNQYKFSSREAFTCDGFTPSAEKMGSLVEEGSFLCGKFSSSETAIPGSLKEAHITLLTGSAGSGKSSLAEKLKDNYDLVVGTDTGKVVDGKYVSLSKEEKEKIRREREEKVLEVHRQGKRVLVEGFPEGHLKHPQIMGNADRVLLLATPHIRGIIDVGRRSFQRGTPLLPDLKMAIETRLRDGKHLKEIEQHVGKGAITRIRRDYVEKKAAIPGSKEDIRANKKVDAFFRATEPKKRWDEFKEDVERKSFVQRMLADPRTDQKLLIHADSMNRLATGQRVGVAPSANGETYEIKRLRGSTELGCTCADWRYKKSVAPPGERECKHVRLFKGAHSDK